ncbi:hypothetical protein IT400_02365 [Candidatus Nomurabacteria bacterium]|nr:hypothetical protein [Candidatus Nomurabacteria bacterium]
MENKPIKQYLPSPQFVKKASILLGIIILTVVIIKIIPKIRSKINKNNVQKEMLVKDIVIQDQNSNGIQDWEEALWGLDPFGDGASNKEYIVAKKKTLNKDNVPESELTEDDKMAREFFALVVSLQQSGNLNEASMKTLAEQIGNKIVTKDIPNIYTEKMIQAVPTTPANLRIYYNTLKKIYKKYANRYIGEEFVFIGQAIANNDPQALKMGLLAANDYHNFGKDLMTIIVPTSLINIHLEFANNYENTAKSIELMSNLLDDPISGMAAIVKYKKYNDGIISTIDKMTTFFKRNGIIK